MAYSKYLFQLISTVTIGLQILVGVIAVFLVQTMIPNIEAETKVDIPAVTSINGLIRAISVGNEEGFWNRFALSKDLHTSEKALHEEIQTRAELFWQDGKNAQPLLEKIQDLQVRRVQQIVLKNEQQKFYIVSGSWALGFLVLFSVFLQVISRTRVTDRLIDPTSELVSVLRDYNQGNRLRRFHDPQASLELREGGVLLNKILDRDTLR